MSEAAWTDLLMCYMEVKAISENQMQYLIISSIIGAVIGGSGITGTLFYFMRRYIENKLLLRESEDEKKKEQRIKRKTVEDELQYCEGRLFFWLHKAIVTQQHNGDLEKAFENYMVAEEAKKHLDREILAESE